MLSKTVTIRNAFDLAKAAEQSLTKQAHGKSYLHFQTKVIYVAEINRTSKNKVIPKPIPETQLIHAVRSVGFPGVVEIRNFDCCCHPCVSNSGQCVVEQSDEWRPVACQKSNRNWKKKIGETPWVPLKIHKGMENESIMETDTMMENMMVTEIETIMENESVMETRTMMEKVETESLGDTDNSHSDFDSTLLDSENEINDNDSSALSSIAESDLESEISIVEIESESECEAFSWSQVQEQLLNCKTFPDLEYVTAKIKEPSLTGTKPHIYFEDSNIIDQIAYHFLPPNAPIGYIPVQNYGDGNCFCRAISQLIFGNEDHHLEMRMHIVLEAV